MKNRPSWWRLVKSKHNSYSWNVEATQLLIVPEIIARGELSGEIVTKKRQDLHALLILALRVYYDYVQYDCYCLLNIFFFISVENNWMYFFMHATNPTTLGLIYFQWSALLYLRNTQRITKYLAKKGGASRGLMRPVLKIMLIFFFFFFFYFSLMKY